MNAWRDRLVALDLETTGLKSGQGDRIIEIGLVWAGETGLESWATLVNPGRHIRSTDIHGLTDKDVLQSPRFAGVAQELFERLHNQIVVLHNAKVDLAFLRVEFTRAGSALPAMHILDTFGLSRHIEGLTSRSLASLCAHYQIAPPNHRACEDARATLQLAKVLLEVLDPDRQLSMEAFLQLGQKNAASAAAASGRKKLRAALEEAMREELPIAVRYQSLSETTVRVIRVRQINSREVRAFCELRQDERVFRLDRIALVE